MINLKLSSTNDDDDDDDDDHDNGSKMNRNETNDDFHRIDDDFRMCMHVVQTGEIIKYNFMINEKNKHK